MDETLILPAPCAPVIEHTVSRLGQKVPLILVRVSPPSGHQIRYCGQKVDMPFGLVEGGFGLKLLVHGETIEVNPAFVSEILSVRLWCEEHRHHNDSFVNPLVSHHVLPKRFTLEASQEYASRQRETVMKQMYRSVKV